MEVTKIHNHSFEPERDLLEVEYSIEGDPQETYREISLYREDFNEYYPFGGTMEIYDIDDTHYELNTQFEFDEQVFKNALTEYLTIYEDELGEVQNY